MINDVSSEPTFVDDLKGIPACCRLAFAVRWVRSVSTVLANIGKGLPKKHLNPGNQLIELAEALVCNPYSPPKGLDKAASRAKLANAHFGQAFNHFWRESTVQDDDDPICALLAGTWSMFGALNDFGQAAIAYRDCKYDSLAEYTHQCILGVRHALDCYGKFVELTSGMRIEKSMWVDMICDDFEQLETQAIENGWQDDTPLPAAVFVPSYFERRDDHGEPVGVGR